MSYPEIPRFDQLTKYITEYGRLLHEFGAKDVEQILKTVEQNMADAIERLKGLPVDQSLAADEPNGLSQIKKLRTEGPRSLWNSFSKEKYIERLEGSILARFAGCTLGAPVEFWSIEEMEEWASYIGDPFPPIDYWSKAKNPNRLRYGKSPFYQYTRDKMCGIPVDDDITYTLLGLLIAEDYGVDFTIEDVGKAWLKYLPHACTAEAAALQNLREGIPAASAAEKDNPYCQWIGADIRSDPWAYISPAYPEKAAELAFRDAFLTHRRNGIYGEMFFSAAIAAAFEVDNAIDALKIGLTEIPRQCSLYKEVTWALQTGKAIHNYKDARLAVDEHFKGMSGVHTNNNACLTVFGLMIGGNDVTKVISETVAMGLDNDCTAATAGSIVGAITGKKGIPAHWYKNFNNRVSTYMNEAEEFEIRDVLQRFMNLAEKTYSEKESG